MTRWKVVYQSVPYNYSTPGTLLIDAETKADAWATAYEELTRRGMAVFVPTHGSSTTGITEEQMRALGLKSEWHGNVHIRSIDEHNPVIRGKVVER